MVRFGVVALAVVAASAQTFEVVSIKPSGPNSVLGWEGGPGSNTLERYTYGQATLRTLIMTAYDLQDFQISSKAPLDRDRFDVAAKVPSGATKEQFRAMLRNVLVDRFHLKAHTEAREFPACRRWVFATGRRGVINGRLPAHFV